MNRPINPIVLTKLPIIVGFTLAYFDIMKPEDGANIRNTIINGSWISALVIAFPPNPNGGGLLTKTGIV